MHRIIRIPYNNFRRSVKVILSIFEFFKYKFLLFKTYQGYYECNKYLIFFDTTTKKKCASFKGLFAPAIKTIISEADKAANHIFDLLGSGEKKLSKIQSGYQPIDWHTDFKSGFSWNPSTFYYLIKYGHQKGVDVKVPWELSRIQHTIVLGQAYSLTEDPKYAEEFYKQIEDWIDNNPVGFGVNWKCPMDIAIRVTNWLVGMEFFSEYLIKNKDFLKKFYNSVYQHGNFIFNHLEYSRKITTNHYLSDVAGLFFISIYCPFFKESDKWRKFTTKELHKEIERQVYADGCDFEGSTSYHRLALELFFYPALIAQRVGIEFSRQYIEKLYKMFEFSLYSIKPNGKSPQIGDNDNGRFLIFSKRDILDHTYLLSFGAIFFNDSNFKTEHFGFDQEGFWIFGQNEIDTWLKLPFRNLPVKSKAFPNAGWFILRENDDYCFISCGQNGSKGIGGHSHNDKLSFELMLKGHDIIVDPGTYVYTPFPEERNKFRSTNYHNTAIFDDVEQGNMSFSIFELPQLIKINFAEIHEDGDKVWFSGEIEYKEKTFKRNIYMLNEKSKIIIEDEFSKNISSVKRYFHLFPEVTYNNGILKTGTRKYLFDNTNNIDSEEYDYSPSYGKKVKSSRICIKNKETTTLEIEVI